MNEIVKQILVAIEKVLGSSSADDCEENIKQIVNQVGTEFPLRYQKDYSEYVGKLQRVRQAQIGEIMAEIREWYEKYWKVEVEITKQI